MASEGGLSAQRRLVEPAESCGHSPGEGFCHDSAESFHDNVQLQLRGEGLNCFKHASLPLLL